MKKVLFLVSGGGGNLKFFDHALRMCNPQNVVLYAVADRDCDAVRYARTHGIESSLIKYSREHTHELAEILGQSSPDVIVTNWHKVIDAVTVRNQLGKMINLHYSLLPAFSGLIGVEPIKRAFESGCKFIGPTCHWVDEGVDTGAIISQSVFPTGKSLDLAITTMFRRGCFILYNVVHGVLGGRPPLDDPESSWWYQPALDFNPSLFDEKFWLSVASS